MGFPESISHCLRNFTTFGGRASRSEYWWFVLFNALVNIALSVVLGAVLPEDLAGILTAVAMLALFLPGLAVSVRRMHDTNRSGWWLLLTLLPLVGGIIVLIWFCMRGTAGPNRFGADPLVSSFFAGVQPTV